MNEVTIGIAIATAAGFALFGGWAARKQVTIANWSFALASFLGLVVLRTSSFEDLDRVFLPGTAIGWLPWICLLSALVQSFRGYWQVLFGVIAGTLIPLRLLWGSIYLTADSSWPTWLTIVFWMLSLSSLLIAPQITTDKRLSWTSAGWLVLVAVAVIAVISHGSMTYAMSVAVVGLSGLTTFVVTGQLPRGLSVVCGGVIGLAVAFSELPVGLGAITLFSMIGLTWLPRMNFHVRWPKRVVGFGTALVLVLATFFSGHALVSMVNELGAYDNPPYQGYEGANSSLDESESPADLATGLPDPFEDLFPN